MSDSASAFFDSYFRAGVLQGICTLHSMIADSLPPAERARLDTWRENVIAYCHGLEVPAWSPPPLLTRALSIPDPRLPQPIVRNRESRPPVDAMAAKFANMSGPPLPPTTPATDKRVAGGRTYHQIVSDNNRRHSEDSEMR